MNKRLDDIEKRLTILEKLVRDKSLDSIRDKRWDEFVRIVRLQKRHQKFRPN